MYSKIYKEIFINNYALKKKLKGYDNIWIVKVSNQNYYLYVYEDTEIVEGFRNYNEAELLNFSYLHLEDNDENLFLRIRENKKFLDKLRKFKKTNSYLFRSDKYSKANNNNGQGCLFDYDNFVI